MSLLSHDLIIWGIGKLFKFNSRWNVDDLLSETANKRSGWSGEEQDKDVLSLEYKRLRVAIAVMSLITIRRVMNSLMLNCRNVMNRSLRSPWSHSHGLFSLSKSWVDLFIIQGVVEEIWEEQKSIRDTIQPQDRNRKWPPNYDSGDRCLRWHKELV